MILTGAQTKKRKRKATKSRLIIVLALVIALTGIVTYKFPAIANALWNEDDAVHINPQSIENGTLIIGTHLIYMGVLTDDLYSLASTSAGDSGQDRIYYKSELDGGAWCDITDANSLAAISGDYSDPTGMSALTAVEDSVIAALFFSFHTKSDGITYDLRTNAAVNIFDMDSPYDLENMPELQPLKMQYDMYREMQDDTDMGKYRIERIDKFWNTAVRTSETDKADANLAALQRYYQTLSGDDMQDEMAAVQGVMSSVDALRRAIVLAKVENVLSSFIEEAQAATDNEIDDDWSKKKKESTLREKALTDADLKSALNDSLANVQTSLTEQQGRQLEAGVTVLSSLRYEVSNSLIANANSGNNAAADIDTAKLMDISSIEGGQILHQASEASLLNSELIPAATSRLEKLLSGGETAAYKGAEGAAKKAVLKEGIAADNTARGELESFITAYAKRIVAEESVKFMDERLTLTEEWLNTIPNDAFNDGAQTCVQNHITFLSKLKLQIQQSINGDTLAQLMEEKAGLQTDYMSALDKNSLAGALEIEEKISELDGKIAEIESEINAKITDLEKQISDLQHELNAAGGDSAALERELSLLKAQLNALAGSLAPNSVGGLAVSLRAEGLSVVENGGNEADLTSAIAALGSMMDMNSKVAFPAAKDIYDAIQKKNALDGGNAFAAQVTELETLLTNGKAAYDASVSGDKSAGSIEKLAEDFMDSLGGDSGLGGGSGSGDGGDGSGSDSGANGSGAGGSGLGTVLGSGSGFDITSGKGAIAYINALKEFYEATGSDTAERMMAAEAQKQFNLGNPFVYKQVDDPTGHFLPITAVRSWFGMRYVWNRNLNKAVLTRGTEYYSFTAWSSEVSRNKDKSKSDTMTGMTGFLGCIYIPGSYTEENFDCEPVYLPDSDLGILMAEEIQTMSDAMLELFMQ
ncbi:MAG: hypothetical protein LBN34_02765 [Clostridiales Family XIII bacterium]|jgi:hypothetical protein|nr:hypothetical protein [Clostridiales Family XIII bacterium]